MNKHNQEEKYAEEYALLEPAMSSYAKSDYNDEQSLSEIASILAILPLYFPVEIDLVAMFGELDPETLTR